MFAVSVSKKPMHSSLNASLVVLFVIVSAATGWAQGNTASPPQGSGLPRTPITSTHPQPPNPTPAQPTNTTDTTPNSTPAATPSAESATPESKAADNPGVQQGAGRSATGAPATQPQTPAQQPAPPAQPKTEILDSSATSGGLSTDGHDPILDPAPVPRTTTTLVGGTIAGVDRLRNRLIVHVFGGGSWKVNFDERTHIFRNGAETTQLALKKGERVYVDTQLDPAQHEIFARNIRVGVATPPADADGQIMGVDLKHGEVTLRDTLNSVPVHFAVDQGTRISNGLTPAALKDIRPGTLVHVRFSAERPNRGLAREISIIAAPGSNFTFAGRVTFLDLHRGLLAVQNSTDDRNYEIHFSPTGIADRNSLVVGSEVRVVATFEGSRYAAQSVMVTKGPEAMER
jgi:hypothetical protein